MGTNEERSDDFMKFMNILFLNQKKTPISFKRTKLFTDKFS